MVLVASSHFGSSPPARGTPVRHRRHHGLRRFIPARAGNTGQLGSGVSQSSVHPRPRGEHLPRTADLFSFCGSSPPARGTPGAARIHGRDVRFIPARAGNTSTTSKCGTCRSVHPRPRGEHRLASAEGLISTGSSPPARGTRKHDRYFRGVHRFIPARAGNTECSRSTHSPPTVHPRPRGEHPTIRSTTGSMDGSSPPARGTRGPLRGQRRHGRFIPARAGNTARLRTSLRRSTGSSPPARGTPTYQVTGSTRHTVHPRPRGEHVKSPRYRSS